ncbi:DNA endonuclease RBBP8-like [Temnothorax curvispinosus]|uniref:DNA endonuclease RBBP8-like n=1 Tax=Temnothorax curvispinosus TaxID=300111 RepID=A0A6J1Q0Q7_9HYME|nr:DNA endonuclease RBBP8-like [Temnothorax curvispinosus]
MDDTENKLPEKKTLLNKFKRSKRKVITKHLNIRCKADRAKLKGSDCWECREYYNNLGLPEEQLQKRKNQISRHRHKYKRPNTPPGFWDPEFPETSDTD